MLDRQLDRLALFRESGYSPRVQGSGEGSGEGLCLPPRSSVASHDTTRLNTLKPINSRSVQTSDTASDPSINQRRAVRLLTPSAVNPSRQNRKGLLLRVQVPRVRFLR